MRFEINPQMIITQEELVILDNALKLCRDMDAATTFNGYDEDNEDSPSGCDICPKRWTCSKFANECVFIVAHKALKEIIDMAVIK